MRSIVDSYDIGGLLWGVRNHCGFWWHMLLKDKKSTKAGKVYMNENLKKVVSYAIICLIIIFLGRFIYTRGITLDYRNVFRNMNKYEGNGSSSNFKICYISPDGSDDVGDGTSENPFVTVNKALSSNASKVMVKQGIYTQTIDFANAKHGSVSIVPYDTTGRVVFVHPDAFITSSEQAVRGYYNVYSCNYNKSIHEEIRLYQDGVPDADTLISDAERNPYERGQAYRCLDTKIVPCSSNNLNDALTEIENSKTYKYYHDTSNGVLYFSRPKTVTMNQPIMQSYPAGYIFANQSRALEVSIYGIECKYMRFNAAGAIFHVEDCKVANVYGAGGFIYDCGLSTEFVRCEASGTYYANGGGDGFNGHSYSEGDTFSKQTTCRLVDCWSHDNMDDGYSDHERSETEIYGGLFEYNGKGGVTPSFGSHCACYNVVSRKNYSGFLYCGEATQEEGGKYGQMLCVMCLAEDNIDPSLGYGFGVSQNGNRAKLINCKSIGNKIGYYCGSDTILELIDCGASDNTTVKDIRGTLYIKNTELVTK